MSDSRNIRDVIEAAGGLLWRDSPRGLELAVVRRDRHGGDWTLPKGKLHAGERWHEAALREVQEETGCEPELGAFAGSNSYLVEGRPKVVLFWHMTLPGPCEFRESREVSELRWATDEEALGLLDYPGEAALVK